MNTTTAKAIVERMVLENPALGRVETVASLAAQTLGVSALALGGSSQQFVNDELFRFDTATTADRIRRVTSFAPTTGVATHTGTAYSDTTVGTEKVAILKHPTYLLLKAVQATLPKVIHNNRTVIPTLANQDTVWLADLDWINQPSDILRITWSKSPVLNKNRNMQAYSSYNSSGVLVPDFWTLTGASATMARSTTQKWRGQPSSLKITRAGTDCYLSQATGLLETGVSADNLRGESITAVFPVYSAVASQVRVSIYDGVTTTTGSFHTGGSGWEELSATATIGATATTVEIRCNVITDNAVAYVGEGYAIIGTATNDTIRRDNYESEEEEMPRDQYEQSGSLNATLPQRSTGGTWAIWSKRGYPQLDSARFAAGTADADVIDAPVLTVAVGAIAQLYESMIDGQESGAKFGPLAALWSERFGSLNGSHLSPTKGPEPMGALAFRARMQLSAPGRRY